MFYAAGSYNYANECMELLHNMIHEFRGLLGLGFFPVGFCCAKTRRAHDTDKAKLSISDGNTLEGQRDFHNIAFLE
ncbi:hypothetical protein CC2G_008632 [Coprinopsis cinerea AmutBmut pab1-1]|nr:hypothetical protein CC2G_008632 [Coprinopsis cinerea AmutBmut pab1-1]